MRWMINVCVKFTFLFVHIFDKCVDGH
jgi:hypothetical protein